MLCNKEMLNMPPQVNFSKEDILNVAFEIVRQNGLESLTARNIAWKLNSSTQPIYRAFDSMKDLEIAIIDRAKEFGISYLLQQDEKHPPFLSIGLQYLRFAWEEKELFKLLYLSGRIEMNFEHLSYPLNVFLERMIQDPYLQGLDEAQLRQIFTLMWIFTHGLTTLASVDSARYSETFILDCLHQMGRIVIEWEHQQRKGEKSDENHSIKWQP